MAIDLTVFVCALIKPVKTANLILLKSLVKGVTKTSREALKYQLKIHFKDDLALRIWHLNH